MSVGVVIVTHYRLGEEFLQVLRLIVPGAPHYQAVSVDPKQSVDELRGEIARCLREQDEGDGVLVLTDMFGGTPSNIALSFHDEQHAEVVTGMNLPMLIKLATQREERPLEELAGYIRDYGQRNISVASELLPEKKSEP
jgi:PTS system mannose-specific IIA component